ncbi:hypothetical protein INT48_008450 [Thamnidium elegans]|uniref:Fcf2 pre-rRNA processing C-terminal domain-containing protein n=1 Tax=Thamnidium elegans TaxID=101142 RepID=A0A8H7VUK0_9FUNG|nr:hypothetical protein INT48_008450 [Thamnidium elegans]
MTERLTRAHRRKLESKTQQKIDLDNLAKLDLKQMEAKQSPTKEIEETQLKQVEIAKEESEDESAEESEEDSEEESAEESEEDSDDDDDLDELLKKAQEALKIQSANIQLEDTKKPIDTKISKMDLGIAVGQELYFNIHTGRSKLVTEAVELLSPGEKSSKKAAVTLKPSKDDEPKKLNKKERQIEREKTTGSAWFDMPKPEITPEIKRDLQVLKMRHILDRKRHYKKMGNRPDPKYFQIGTIIESPTEFYSARLNKKDRKQTIVDELMANDDQKSYYKRNFKK